MAFEQYKGQCLGRLLYFLYEFNHSFDHCTYGNGEGFLGKEKVVTWEWKGLTDVPEIKFHGRFEHHNNDIEYYMEQQLRWSTVSTVCEKDRTVLVDGVCPACERDKKFKAMLNSHLGVKE